MNVLSATERAATGDAIAAVQLPSGLIPWFPGGHADPWNHVEAAMALALAGRRTDAERAYQWLADRQRPDGSWHNYYVDDDVHNDRLDTNCVAYIAAGVRHHHLHTGDRGFLEAMWPVVDNAIEFVLAMQTERGEIIWARHGDGTPWSFALLTGSSSITHSLGAASAIATELGHERPHWEAARQKLAHVICTTPEAFAAKDRWAMDWYYPVLAGVLTGERGRARLASGAPTFEHGGHGVRCVSDRPWITTAETCEAAMAYARVGDLDHARALVTAIGAHRHRDGGYLTGLVHPDRIEYPADERSTYSAAAVLLADDALAGTTPTARLFLEE